MSRLATSRVTGALLIGVLAIGCSSGGDEPALAIETQGASFTECARVAVVDYHRFMAQIEIVATIAEGRSPGQGLQAGITPSTDPTDPPHTFTYFIQVDTTGDRRLDTQTDGNVTFSSDPTDGIDVGDMAMIDFVIGRVQDSDGQKFGTADMAITFNAKNQILARGMMDPDSADIRCEGWFSMPQAAPMEITFPNDIITGSGPAPTGTVLQLETEGLLNSEIRTPGDVFVGAITLVAGSNSAQFAGALNGQAFDAPIAYFPESEDIVALADCTTRMFEVFIQLAGTWEDLTEMFIDSGRDLPNLPDDVPGFSTSDTGSANVVNYTVEFGAFGNPVLGGTMTGQLSVYTRELVGQDEITTWQISYNLDASGVGGIANVTGKTLDLPVRARIGTDDTYVYWIAAGATIDRADCLGVYQIAETEPLEPDDLPGRQRPFTTGRWLFASMLSATEDILEGQFVFTPSGAFPIYFKINGIPVPGDAFPPPPPMLLP